MAVVIIETVTTNACQLMRQSVSGLGLVVGVGVGVGCWLLLHYEMIVLKALLLLFVLSSLHCVCVCVVVAIFVAFVVDIYEINVKPLIFIFLVWWMLLCC